MSAEQDHRPSPHEAFAIIPTSGSLSVVSIGQLVDQLDSGATWDEAVMNSGIDTIDFDPAHFDLVRKLNETGDGEAYWAER